MATFSRHKVLQRVRTLFILTVLIPVVLGAGVTYFQVRASLEEQSYLRSKEASRFRGALILEQLLQADESLQALAQGEAGSPSLDALVREWSFIPDASQPGETAVFPASNRTSAASLRAMLGDCPSNGRTCISVAGAARDIYFSLQSARPDSPAERLYARLNKTAVFGHEDEQLLYANLCVFESREPIYCTSELATQMPSLTALLREHEGLTELKWSGPDGTTFFASVRDLFLPSHFNSSLWTVAVVESEDLVYAPIRVFNWLFPALTLLSVLLVIFLVVRQTRNQLGPLSKLQGHAARLGAGDFDARLNLRTDNEFQELADSFNVMATKLGSQFHFLRAMSEIDSALLRSEDISSVCESVLSHATDILPICSAAILVYHLEGRREHCLYSLTSGERLALQESQVSIPAWLESTINASREMTRIPEGADRSGAVFSLLEGDGPVQVHPLHFEGHALGALLLREDADWAETREIEEYTRGIEDRLTVALSGYERQEKLYFQANYDHLTELPNRPLFVDRLQQYLARAERAKERVAVVYADLDRFKSVNDTLGHDRGDQVLREAASRFRKLVRGTDTVARLSGDEFAFAIPGIKNHIDLSRVIRGVSEEFSSPFQIDGQEFVLGLSMGVALFPQDGDTAEALLKKADIAMYRIKDNPTMFFKFYEELMTEEIQERSALAQDLLQAVRSDELSLVYQPKVDAQTYRIRSAEALIRWHHPERGWVSPAKFIPLAEETGLIPQIGEFALWTACEQFVQWREQGLGIEQIAVNVSPRQIQYTDLVGVVRLVLERTGIPASCLELEITEDLLVENYQKTEEVLSELKSLGVKIALDDFGTGYSSLSHIHELSFDTLKIDKCFVENIGQTESSDAIVKSIIALGQSLNKSLVAEGVETKEQLRFLAGTGCQLIQGYYFSKPLGPDELSDLFARNLQLMVSDDSKLASY